MNRYFRYLVALAVASFALFGTARPAAAWERGVIWDLKVITGPDSNISCGPGWYRVDRDLNQGAGGDYVYLCVTYDKNQHVEPIAGVYVCTDSCPPGYTQLPGNLNADAGGEDLYFGYFRGPITPVREILFSTVYGTSKYSCQYAAGQIDSNGNLVEEWRDPWEPIPGEQDLNVGAGGEYIQPCVRYMPGGTRDNTEAVFDFILNKTDASQPPKCPEGYVLSGADVNEGFSVSYWKSPCVLKRGPDRESYPDLVAFGGPLTMLYTVARTRGSSTDLQEPCEEIGGTKSEFGAHLDGAFMSDREIYFCTSRAHPPHDQYRAIVDVRIISLDDRPSDVWAVCGQQLGGGWETVPALNEEGVNDLNAGGGGKFLYTCMKKGPAYREGALDGPSFNVAHGGVVQVDAQWRNANGNIGRSNVLVSAYIQATDDIDGDVPVTCDRDNEDFIRAEIYPLGRVPNPVWCTAIDSHDNVSKILIDLEVIDRAPQLIDMPRTIEAGEAGPNGTAPAVFTVRAIDNIDSFLAAVCSPASGSWFSVGQTEVQCTATDLSGLSTHGTLTVLVTEPIPPGLIAHPDIEVEAGAGGKAHVAFEVQWFDDGRSGLAQCAPSSGSEFTLGATTVQCSAADALGNTGTTSFKVTVVDRNAPTLNVPGDVTVEATGPGLTTLPKGLPGSASATDAESGLKSLSRTPAGTQFPIGTTVITWTATDNAGNVTTRTQNVTVADTKAPVIASLSTLTFEASNGNGITLTSAQLPEASATDIVGVAQLTREPAGFDFALGTTTITWSAADTAGNIGTAIQTIVVRDTTPPVVTGDSYIYLTAASAQGGVANYTVNATDAVDGTFAATCSIPSGTTIAMGEYQVTCTATDRGGNAATRTFTLLMGDWEPPVMTAPAEVIVEATGLVTPVTFDVTALDAIAGPVEVRCLPKMGSSLPIGTTIVRCGADDGWLNFAEHSKTTVIVRDTTAPSIATLSPIVVEAASASGALLSASQLAAPAASDAVGVVSITRAPAGFAFPLGRTAVTWTVTDAAGNAATAVQDVIVRDTTAPTLTAGAPIVAEASSAAGATLAASVLQLVSSQDATGAVTITRSPAGFDFPIGSTIVTWTATDVSGNAATATQEVIVRDTTAPLLALPAATRADAPTLAGAIVNYAASAIDSVDGALPVACVPASGTTLPIGVTTVTCTARDAAGNTAAGWFTVDVRLLPADQLIALLAQAIEAKRLDKQLMQILRSIEQDRDARACAQILRLRRGIEQSRELTDAERPELLAMVDALAVSAGCTAD